MTMTRMLAPLAVAIMAIVGVSSTATTVAGAVTQNEELVKQGEQLYDKYKCDKCHRIGRRGAKKGPLDGVASKLSEAEIRHWLTNPSEMEAQMDDPPTGTNSMANTLDKKPLAEAEVDAVAAFLMTLTD